MCALSYTQGGVIVVYIKQMAYIDKILHTIMTQYQEKRKLSKVNQVNMIEEEIIITEHLKTIQKKQNRPNRI